jgi:hypothetical protein
MRPGILATVVGLVLSASSATATDLEVFDLKTTRDLLDVCTTPEGDPIRQQAIHYCVGFLEGAVEYHDALSSHRDMKRLTCYPTGTTREDGARVFVRWARAHQEDRKLMSEAPVIGLMRSLNAEWPCKEGQK